MSTDRNIFLDSWAFLALANRRDAHHKAAVKFYEEIRIDGYMIVTSDYILDEVITSLFKTVSFQGAQKFVEALLIDIRERQIILEKIDDNRFNYAWLLRGIYQDKPDISFTDLTSFVLMKELNISGAFTGDRHFEKVNLGFRILPCI